MSDGSWYGRLPAHWGAGNIRRFASMKTGHTPSRQHPEYWIDCTIPWFTLADVWQLRAGARELGETSEQISELGLINSAAELLPPGTVVLSRTASVGFSGIMPVPMATSQDFWNWVPKPGMLSRFLWYQFQSMRPEFERLMMGSTHRTIYQGDAASLRIVAPPIGEQQAIVDYLDRETAQIDAFIAKNEELITLLSERRAAVIAEAVTRGIDAARSQRASGVEWLGTIPVHWSVQRLASTIARARNGVWGADPEGGAEDLRCVRVADFDRPKQRIHDRAHTLRKVSASERAGRVLRNGDLLLEKSGGGEKSPVGFVVLYDRDEPAVCSNFVARVQLREDMDPAFWTYVHGALYRLRITEKSLKQSTGIQNLDQSAYFNEYVAVPPYQEQRAISGYLERRSGEIDAAIGTARRGVQLARERRAALISAAVTGKMDVRESA